MTGQQLKNSILQLAIQGKLVPQDPNDEPASKLLERIRKEKELLVKVGKLKKKDLVTIPISDEEKPFEIPESWEWCRVAEIMSVKGGKRIPLGHKWTDVPTDHIYIRVTDMKNETIIDKDLRYIQSDVYELIKKYTISKDDLYITVAGTIGSVGIVPDKFDGMNLTENADKLTDISIYKEYVLKCFNSPFIQCQFASLTNQLAQPKLSIRNIQSLIFPLPPLNEQRRIVSKIEELLPLVEQYGKSQEKLEELNKSLPDALKKSILQEAIMGKLVPQDPTEEPASELLASIRKEKEKLVKEGKLKKKDLAINPITDEEKPFDIPESWEWCRFEDIAYTFTGKTPERGNTSYWHNPKHPWVSISDMKDCGRVSETKEALSDEGAKLIKQISPKGSLIMSFKLTVGRTSILNIDAYHNEAIVTIFPYIDINNNLRDYLFQFLPIFTKSGDTKDAIKGRTLNSKSIAALLIPLPPISEQRRILTKVEELFKIIK